MADYEVVVEITVTYRRRIVIPDTDEQTALAEATELIEEEWDDGEGLHMATEYARHYEAVEARLR